MPSLEWKENCLDSALNQVIANGGAMWGLHVIVIGFVLEYMMINHALLDTNGTKGLSVLHILNYQRTELKFAWFSAGDLIWDFTSKKSSSVWYCVFKVPDDFFMLPDICVLIKMPDDVYYFS